MTDANTICHDLDLLDDWLAGKGYGEEAGLVLRAMTLIHKLQDGVRSAIQERDVLSGENWDLRAENEKLRAALRESDQHFIRVGNERAQALLKVDELRAALKRLHDAASDISEDDGMNWREKDWWRDELRAAAAALKEITKGNNES